MTGSEYQDACNLDNIKASRNKDLTPIDLENMSTPVIIHAHGPSLSAHGILPSSAWQAAERGVGKATASAANHPSPKLDSTTTTSFNVNKTAD